MSSEALHPDSNRHLCGWILAVGKAKRLASVFHLNMRQVLEKLMEMDGAEVSSSNFRQFASRCGNFGCLSVCDL